MGVGVAVGYARLVYGFELLPLLACGYGLAYALSLVSDEGVVRPR